MGLEPAGCGSGPIKQCCAISSVELHPTINRMPRLNKTLSPTAPQILIHISSTFLGCVSKSGDGGFLLLGVEVWRLPSLRRACSELMLRTLPSSGSLSHRDCEHVVVLSATDSPSSGTSVRAREGKLVYRRGRDHKAAQWRPSLRRPG
jgi:hypothetical protein